MWPPTVRGLASLGVTTPRRPVLLDRRTLLRGGLGGLGAAALGGAALGACADKGDTTNEGVQKGPELSLTAMFPRDVPHVRVATPTRLPYTLSDVEGVPFGTLESALTFRVSFDGEAVGEPTEVEPHADGVPRPYLPFEFTFPRPGIYDIETEHEGTSVTSQLQVFTKEEVLSPVVGDPLPPASTPTTTQGFEVDPICTRVPTCPFHEHDLTAALQTDRPIVVLLATPAYCRTTACGPILDLLIEQAQGVDGPIVIHSEVYKNPKAVRDLSDAALAPLPDLYSMAFEPALFVADASHTIVARGDIVVDRAEMAEMLALAV